MEICFPLSWMQCNGERHPFFNKSLLFFIWILILFLVLNCISIQKQSDPSWLVSQGYCHAKIQLLNWRHFYNMPIYQQKCDGLTQNFEKVNYSSIKPII